MAIEDKRILVADDDVEMRNLLSTGLEALGYKNFFVVCDGREALEALRLNDFDLVICDWIMPHLQGIELLRLMRADKKWKRVPFIMVTAEATSEDIELAVDMGCTDYIIKPFDFYVLEQRITKCIG